MLKLKASPTFTAKVEIPTPNGPVSIKVDYKHMTKAQYAEFIDKESKSKRSDEEALMDIMAGWANVDAEFSKENVAELCQQYHRAATAIVEGFIVSLTAGKAGN
jgi:hypothetical protein